LGFLLSYLFSCLLVIYSY